MGQDAGSIGSIVLGVVIGVVAVATQQYYLLWTAIPLIAGGAVGLAFKPETPNQQGAQAQELQITTAALGMPIPVIFGPQRVTPNILNYDPDTFEAREIRGDSGGGKGGGSPPAPVIGHEYYLRFELGWCMGEIDAIKQVISMPGEVDMLDNPTDEWIEFADDEMDLTLEGDDAGGELRLYRGALGQTRVATGDVFNVTGMNYRGIVFGSFGVGEDVTFTFGRGRYTGTIPARGFKIGIQPQPRTYQLLALRLSRCIRDDGTTVGSIQTRGSSDTGNVAYYYTNPAAVFYEILTNKRWGRKLSSDIIDETSFALASESYRDRNIGVAFTMSDAADVSNYLEGLQRQIKCLLYWDGEVYKLRNLLEIEETHGAIQTLRESEVSSFSFNRPLWPATINEVRAEYVNEDRRFRADAVHVQDLANQQIQSGYVNPSRIQLTALPELNLAQRQAWRILFEGSYPLLGLTWEMNRFKSQIQIGEVVRLIVNDFTSSVVTLYVMVIDIDDGGSNSEMIRVTGIEDTLLSPVSGEELTVALPSQYPWEVMAGLDVADVDLHEQGDDDAAELTPIRALEIPAIATAGKEERLVFLAQRTSPGLLGIYGLWARPGEEFQALGSQSSFAITAELVDAIPGGLFVDRGPGYQITLTDEDADGVVLQGVAVVDSATDDMESLTNLRNHFVAIGDEIMQVGLFEQVSGSTYRMRNLVRGVMGTPIRTHAAAAIMFYTQNPQPGMSSSAIPKGATIDFRGYPINRFGRTNVGNSFRIDYPGENDEKYLGLGRRPLPPELYDVVDGGATVTIRVRPAFFDIGPVFSGDFEASLNAPNGDLFGMTFGYREIVSTGTVLQTTPQPVVESWTPEAMDDPESGLAELVVTKTTGSGTVTKIRIYSILKGLISANYLEISI